MDAYSATFLKWTRILAITAILALCLTSMVALGLQVANELSKLKNTAERHSEWQIALVRSKYLGLVIEAQQQLEGKPVDLEALRESFDILALNVREFKDSRVFESLLEDATYRENLEKSMPRLRS